MLKWAFLFAVTAIVAGLFGFTEIAIAVSGTAQVLFVVFLVLFVAVVLFALLSMGQGNQGSARPRPASLNMDRHDRD